MDNIEKFISYSDPSIIERMEKEGEPDPLYSYEEYLERPTADGYENNEERKLRIAKEQAGIWESMRKPEDDIIEEDVKEE